MDFYNLIRIYAASKGEKAMWAATKRVSDFLEEVKEEHSDKFAKLIKETYEDMCGPHYNEEFATLQIEQMFFKDKSEDRHYAPNWSATQYKALFEQNKHRLKNKNYNYWDWAVTLEMAYTDNHCLLKTWFPNATEEEIKLKSIDVAINYLNDDDDDDDGRIWHRFNK